MGFLSNLFGKQKRTLKDLTVDDLKREQLSLQNEQRKIDAETERLEKDETQLKSEYAQATSASQKRSIARKIQDLRTRGTGLETRISYCQKMLRSVNGFLVIKENMAFFERMGVASALSEMDMSEVESFINEATIEGTLQQEKLASLLQHVTDGVERISETASDGSLDDLMAELDGEVAETPAAVAETPAAVTETAAAEPELDGVMDELDAAIAKGTEAARQAQAEPKPSQPNPPQREA